MSVVQGTEGRADAQGFIDQDHRLFIAGEWVPPAGGGTIDVEDPGSKVVLTQVASGQAADVDLAVASARRSFDEGAWRKLPLPARGEVLWRVAQLLEAHLDELAFLESLDNGMPLSAARQVFIPSAVKCFKYYAGLADKVHGETSEIVAGGHEMLGYTLREPIGVAGLIVPWNAPLMMASVKVAAALAAGCSVVLKPAEETPLTALRLGELLVEAGVPDGVVNVVTGLGETAGAALAAHDDVDKISFTGSTEVGRLIVQAAAGNLKKLTLELGGKSPMIIFDDADVDQAVATAATAIFANSGQICSAGSRIIIHADILDRVVEGIAAIGEKIRLGYHDQEVDMGPLISAKQLDRVNGYVEGGLTAGAEAVIGGGPADLGGYFFQPTVLVNVNPDMPLVREEIFGPVLAAMAFTDTDEAVHLANDTTYGLASSVFTRDVGRAHAVARRLRTGRVGINVHLATDYSMPGGGYKQSGWGRENGPHGLDPYLETKAVFTLVDR